MLVVGRVLGYNYTLSNVGSSGMLEMLIVVESVLERKYGADAVSSRVAMLIKVESCRSIRGVNVEFKMLVFPGLLIVLGLVIIIALAALTTLAAFAALAV